MPPSVPLVVATGIASRRGKRPDNQDFAAAYDGSAAERATHGLVAVVADGVGGAKGGRIAAELACRSFIDAYYCQPETLGVPACADRAVGGFNRWLHFMGHADAGMEGAATTFAALVLRGREAHALHVGDSRIWHFRDGVLTRLTEDHALSQPDLRHVLYRALGIEGTVRLDHRSQVLAAHDRLLITSDGVHGALSDKALAQLIGRRGAAAQDAAAIVDAALAAGSTDNATAVLLDVVAVPAPDQAGIAALMAGLPLLPTPKNGDSVDGFRLEQVLSDGRYSRLFIARRGGASAVGEPPCVLKFPKPEALSQNGARLAFMREMLIAGRVRSPYVAEVIAPSADQQSRLYVMMPFYAGQTLEARLKRGVLPYAAGLTLAAMLARGVVALHRLDIVHRDIKPDNVLLGAAGGLRLLDLGVARLPQVAEFAEAEIPGTPGYLAPEMFAGNQGDAATDQFALGVTLYRMFTGTFPYGESEPFHRPGFGRLADPVALRPDMPAWLAATLRRAVDVRPEQRFSDVVELLLTLESGSARAAPVAGAKPLLARNPILFWQLVALGLGMALLAALALR